MAAAFITLVKNLLIPHGILFFIIYLLPEFVALPHHLWSYARFYPIISFAVAAALCWRFHKDRYLFIILSVAFCERAVYYLLTGTDGRIQSDALIYTLIGIILPFNLAVFELIKDRGVLTFWGIIRWLIIAVELCLAAFVHIRPDSIPATQLHHCLQSLENLLPPIVPDLTLVAFVFCALVLASRFLFRQSPLESSSLWVLLLLYLGIHRADSAPWLSYYAAFGGLFYIAAILDTSYRLAYYDELTGLPARRALNDQLVRLGSKYTIAMADVDHFKKFNDRYGHDVGDQVLKMVASKLKGVSGGRAFRYGGEEFAIVFPGGSIERAKPSLESVRETIAGTKFIIRRFGRTFKQRKPAKASKRPLRTVKITISIGAAEKNDRHPTPQDVIQAADKALYKAKRAGRNKVSV